MNIEAHKFETFQEVIFNMQTNTLSSKVSEMASKVIEKLMLASGIIAIVWIFAFLMVGTWAQKTTTSTA